MISIVCHCTITIKCTCCKIKCLRSIIINYNIYSSTVYYLTVYLFMNIGAFSAVIALNKKDKEYVELDEYCGIGFKYPWIGATFSVFLLSLAGFPPTGGFLAKFYIFSSAVKQGLTSLVIIAVLASLISSNWSLVPHSPQTRGTGYCTAPQLRQRAPWKFSSCLTSRQ